jgi:hypothetical protein
VSAIPCPVCGQLRKVMQVWSSEGWHNPACWSCGDPGWIAPPDAADPLAGRPTRFVPLRERTGFVQCQCAAWRLPASVLASMCQDGRVHRQVTEGTCEPDDEQTRARRGPVGTSIAGS